jgi:hypothetical protein
MEIPKITALKTGFILPNSTQKLYLSMGVKAHIHNHAFVQEEERKMRERGRHETLRF